MRIRQNITLFFMLFGAVTAVHSQQARTEFSVNFRLGSATVEPDFADNARQISNITDFLEGVNRDESVEISNISFCGTTSLEGSYQLNRKLARNRLDALERIVRSKVEISENLITRDDYYIPWDDLRSWVDDSDLQQKEAIIDIIDGSHKMVLYAGGATIDERVLKLKSLDNGRVWQQLNSKYFNNMRSASVVIVTLRTEVAEPPIPEPEPEPAPAPEPEPVLVVQPAPVVEEPVVEPAPEPVQIDEYVPHVHLKTNIVGWGLTMANLAVEFDLCRHLSFALPVYYSGMDYYSDDVKFRTFAVMPEFRYWFSDRNDGWFLGGHFGLAWYNFALKTKYRYQDHSRETPALGGGVSVGYRLPLGKSKRWRAEFAVGGGAYHLHYDGFINEPNGMYVGTKKKTYIGLDNVSIAFGYTFDLKKGGAK